MGIYEKIINYSLTMFNWSGNTKGLGKASPLLPLWDLLRCSWPFYTVSVLHKHQSSGLIFPFCWLSFSLMKSSDIDQDLFTDSYCKVCSAQLISESQRVAHYEVRTTFSAQCFQMEERAAWVVVVGHEGAPSGVGASFKNHRASSFVFWAQARRNVDVWGWKWGWGTSFSGPRCFPDSGFSFVPQPLEAQCVFSAC